jgi:hypothetical protein
MKKSGNNLFFAGGVNDPKFTAEIVEVFGMEIKI